MKKKKKKKERIKYDVMGIMSPPSHHPFTPVS
jgi:hypothetical protein